MKNSLTIQVDGISYYGIPFTKETKEQDIKSAKDLFNQTVLEEHGKTVELFFTEITLLKTAG